MVNRKFEGLCPVGGFSLIEVLVALLVLLIGLLGVVGMQYLSLQQVNNANLRSQVNLHSMEMVEMIRSNDNGALPNADLARWQSALQRDVPGATSQVNFGTNDVDIVITWDERQFGADAVQQTFTLRARLDQ